MGDRLELKRVTLSREDLVALPDDERHLLVLIGHIGNELSILNKYLLWSIRLPEELGPEQKAQLTKTAFLLRMTAGKLYEANNLLSRDFYGSGVSKRWGTDLSSELTAALKNIKKYFKGSNVIRMVRNDYAFHFKGVDVGSALDAVDDPFEIYFAEANGNCLYDGPQIVTMVAMLQQVEAGGISEALDKVTKETGMVAGWFLAAANGIVHEIFRRNGLLDNGVDLEHVVVPDACPSFLFIRVP